MKFILTLLITIILNGVVFYFLDKHLFLEKLTVTGGYQGYAIVGALFGLVNALLKPILTLLTYPLRVFTLGLIKFTINGGLLWSMVYILDFLDIANTTLRIESVLTYILAGLVLGIVNYIISRSRK